MVDVMPRAGEVQAVETGSDEWFWRAFDEPASTDDASQQSSLPSKGATRRASWVARRLEALDRRVPDSLCRPGEADVE